MSPELFEAAIDDVVVVLSADKSDPREWAAQQLRNAAEYEDNQRTKLLTNSMRGIVPPGEDAYTFRQAALRAVVAAYHSGADARNRGAILSFWVLLPRCGFDDDEQKTLGNTFRDLLLVESHSRAWWEARGIVQGLISGKQREAMDADHHFHGGHI